MTRILIILRRLANGIALRRNALISTTLSAAFLSSIDAGFAQAERVLGVDVSYWNCGTGSGISQGNWNTAFSTGNRKFVFIRATRGGTTGLDQGSGTPGGGSTSTLSRRYDDSRFVQNISRASAAGLLAGPYHFGRPDVAGNTGADEADHFIQMAGPWMRPGYMMPMFDQEAGQSLGGDVLVQFATDFSDRIYSVMRIRPCIYINGTYSSTFQSASQTKRDLLAKPLTTSPSVIGPAYPMLWDARYYPSGTDPNTIPIQTGNPKDNPTLYSGMYGPWDDYGNPEPWSFWQYSSSVSIPGLNAVDSTDDGDVSHGDIEYVRNYLVPAVWWNDTSGDWSTLANWNSGQTVVAPVPGAGQATPYATGPLPISRLPGAAGTIPNSGQFDTVILERPSANITVTLSTGSYNIRKLYMREALNITGGSLTVNYDPTYRPDNSAYVLHGGPLSAQFSGPVTLSGSGSFNVHTLQVDALKTFSVSGGTLTFDTINLMPHSTTAAKLLVNGNANFNPLAGATATIKRGAGSGNSGLFDLGGANRALSVGNGSSAVDLSVEVPIFNGALTKAGSGTMRVTAANTYVSGTTISSGTLLVNNTSGSGTGSGGVVVNGGILGGTGTIAGTLALNNGGTISPGASIGTLTINGAATLNGTTFMEINRNGGTPISDKIVVNNTLNYGGTLVISNLGATLVGGEVFTIFAANTYAGDFANTVLPPLNAGLNWDLTRLAENGTIRVNRRPIANALAVTNNFPGELKISTALLAGNGSDPDGDALVVSSFGVSTNGVTLTSDGAFLTYLNNANVADQFEFVVSDGRGGTATNLVSIAPSIILTGEFIEHPSADGDSVTLHFSGTPGGTFYLDRSTNLPPDWITISTNVAPADGTFDFTDDFHDLNEPPSSSFYRLRW